MDFVPTKLKVVLEWEALKVGLIVKTHFKLCPLPTKHTMLF